MRTVQFLSKEILGDDYSSRWETLGDFLNSSKIVFLDSETSGLDPYTERLLLLQLTTPKSTEAWVIPFGELTEKEKLGLANCLRGKELVIHNAAFDLRFLSVHLGFDVLSKEYTVFDTYLAEQVLGAGRGMHLRSYASLANTAQRRLGEKLQKDTRKEFIGHMGENFTDDQIKYAAKDLDYLPEIRKQQIEEAKEYGLVPTFKLEFELVKVLTKMHLDGIDINRRLWKQIIKEEQAKKEQTYDALIELIRPYIKQQTLFDDLAINVNSSAQLLQFLVVDYGLKIPDTAEQTLKSQNDPVCEAILEYREHEKMLAAFGESTLAKINPVTKRLHPEFNQCMTATGRFSSDSPNVQQIPGKGEGKRLRRCFRASEGYKMICADYSQIELRILAEFSQEPKLIEAYTTGIDVHTQTASVAFGMPVENISDEQRKIAKIINFATCYGGGPAAVARGLVQVISEDEAREILRSTFDTDVGDEGPYYTLGLNFVKAFFAGMPVAKDYLESSGLSAVHNRFSETPLGRKRFYPELDNFLEPSMKNPAYREIVSSVGRRGRNHPIQGCSADITKISLVNISDSLRESKIDGRILLQVHDEVAVEVPEEHEEYFAQEMGACMIRAGEEFLKLIPVEVEVKTADYWTK
jgi:DNA polymerase I